jgi:hypothetical protein
MSEQRQRKDAVKFRVTPTEKERIHAAAKRGSYPVAEFARYAVLAAADGRPLELSGAKAKALRKFTAEIQKIGIVTRKRAITKDDAERVVDALRALNRAVIKWQNEPSP